MHRELIGQQASLSVPCSMDAAALLIEFVSELIEVGGSHAEEPRQLERKIEKALGALCRSGAVGGQILATFAIGADGVEIRLQRDDAAAPPAVREQVVTAREARPGAIL